MNSFYGAVTDEQAKDYIEQVKAKAAIINKRGVRLEDFMEHEHLMNSCMYAASYYVLQGNQNAFETVLQLIWEIGFEDGRTFSRPLGDAFVEA